MRIRGSRWWDDKEYYYIDTYKDFRIGDTIQRGDYDTEEYELLVLVELTYENSDDVVGVFRNSRLMGTNGYASEYAKLTGKPREWAQHTNGEVIRTLTIIRHGSECYKCMYECKMPKKCWMYKEIE